MSQTVYVTGRNVRNLINDTTPGDYVCADERLRLLIDTHVQLLSDELNYADTWSLAAVTFVSGTYEYSLATGDYRVVAEVRRSADGVMLQRRPSDVISGMRQGANNTITAAKPTDYAIYETSSGQAKIVLFPTPNASGTLDVFQSVAPSPLTDEASTIYLGTAGLRLLEHRVAAAIVSALTDEQRDKIKMGQAAMAELKETSERLLQNEKERTHTIRRPDAIERLRY